MKLSKDDPLYSIIIKYLKLNNLVNIIIYVNFNMCYVYLGYGYINKLPTEIKIPLDTVNLLTRSMKINKIKSKYE
jgi:hypothetical protein